MAQITDFINQLQDYRGVFIFPSVVDSPASITYPQVSVPLYIKEHSLPVRKPKPTEVNTIPIEEPGAGWDISVSMVFMGISDPLTATISGFLVTPMKTVTDPKDGSQRRIWDPTVDGSFGGTSLGLSGNSNADLISAYIEGRMNRTSTGRWLRTDPIYYIDPYGHQYNNVVIAAWDPSYTHVAAKQQFSATVYLEK